MSESPPKRTSGLRFSLVDGAFIAVCAAAAWFLRGALEEMVWIFPVVVGHFFLFCNVFRVRRSFELAWVGIFLANMIGWQAASAFGWGRVLAVQIPATVLFIAAEMRSRRYHGILSRRINGDNLDAWLRGEIR